MEKSDMIDKIQDDFNNITELPKELIDEDMMERSRDFGREMIKRWPLSCSMLEVKNGS